MHRFIIAGLLATFIAMPAFANDTLATYGAGGLVPQKSTEISMESEDLHISLQEIAIEYVFRNQTRKDIDAMIVFPLPDIYGGDIAHVPMNLPAPRDINFIGFRVRDEGKEIPVKLEIKAIFDGKDITKRLNRAGLSGTVFSAAFDEEIGRLSSRQLKSLARDHIIACDDMALAPKSCWAGWTMRAQFYWTQHFPAGGSVKLTQSYRPVVGGGYLVTSSDIEAYVKQHCGTSATLANIEALREAAVSSNDPYLFENNIRYILTTANNWSGPIRHFKLTVTTDKSEDMFLACYPHFTQVLPTSYEFIADDFRPAKDLDLMVLTKSPQPSN